MLHCLLGLDAQEVTSTRRRKRQANNSDNDQESDVSAVELQTQQAEEGPPRVSPRRDVASVIPAHSPVSPAEGLNAVLRSSKRNLPPALSPLKAKALTPRKVRRSDN